MSRDSWDESLTDQQLYGIARGVWGMGKKAGQERYAIVSGAGTARQAIEIRQVVDVNGGRRAYVGSVLQPGDPVYDPYVGEPAPNGNQQNPITHFESPPDNRV